MAINRFEVYLVNLDSTVGSEIKKTHPCLVIEYGVIAGHRRGGVMDLTSEAEVTNTKVKLARLEARYEVLRNDTEGNQ